MCGQCAWLCAATNGASLLLIFSGAPSVSAHVCAYGYVCMGMGMGMGMGMCVQYGCMGVCVWVCVCVHNISLYDG